MQQTGQPWRERAGAGAAQMSFRRGKPLLGLHLAVLNSVHPFSLAQGCAFASLADGLGPLHASTMYRGSATTSDILLAFFPASSQAGTTA